MSERTDDPARPQAWGDVYMPGTAEERAERLGGAPDPQPPGDPSPADDPPPAGRPSQHPTHADVGLNRDAEVDPTLRQDTNEYAFGATTQMPAAGPGYAEPPLGPGNEAMAGGASPAPRGYTGGAMGKVNAGLSPSFAQAASGDPPPWEAPLFDPAEAAALAAGPAGAQPPSAGRSPEDTPQPTLGTPGAEAAPDTGTGTGAGES